MKKNASNNSMALRIFCVAIVVCFMVGLIMMICGNFGIGMIPWFAAMVIGAITLYCKRRLEKKAQDLADIEEEERAYQAKKRAEAQEKK